MRLIGRLKNEASARTFGDYLASQEIRNAVEPESDGAWGIWVYSEDQLDAAATALTGYEANPNDPKFQHASEKAAAVNERARREQEEYNRRVVTSTHLWSGYGVGPLTLALIVACVGVVLIYGYAPPTTMFFGVRDHVLAIRDGVLTYVRDRSMPEIRAGQVWRLITPIFIHFNIFHLLFNMMALKDLAGMIETRQGTLKLALLVLITGVGSNMGQYLVRGPEFGGISGVLYGLFGYIWMRGKFDPTSGLRLNPTDIVMMIGWFFLCAFGLSRIPVANWCHGVGLVMGMIWGATPPLAKKFLKF